MSRLKTKAVAYLRTSSAVNVGADKHSEIRQHEAIAGYAKANGFELVDEYRDADVSGADPIETRPGFTALLDRIEGNGVRTIIVEGADRFARQVIVQELGLMMLQERGVRVITSSGQDLSDTDDPSKVMMRQVAAAFAEFEKNRLVNKLAAARRRKREVLGKCEGRKSHAEKRPEIVALAKKLARKKPKGGKPSLRAISKALADQGHLNERGSPFAAKSIASMLAT